MSRASQAKTPGRISQLGALRMIDRAAWAREVKRAMLDAGGRVPAAAEALGISTRQLFRWLEDPALAKVERAAVGTRPTDE